MVARPEAFSTGAPWLSRALIVSLALHLVAALVWWVTVRESDTPKTTTVDIEIAPPPPKVEALPEEVAKPPESAPEATQDNAATTPHAPEHDEDALALHDAGVDALPDAAPDAAIDAGAKKPRPDAAPDASEPMVADVDILDGGLGGDAATEVAATTDGGGELAVLSDAGVPLGDDAGERIAAIESGSGSGSGLGLGSGEGSGVPAATETGSGSGAPGVDNQPAVAGAPTTAGTAANLLSYFPAGHQVTALIRFDRLRNTEWADPAEQLFKPMPDYQGLFGSKNVAIGSKFDTLVISSPRPRDATATTLVVHAPIPRAELRDFLANPDTPITWTVTKGGMFGQRRGKLFPNDKRVLLSPWRDWIVLAQPTDLAPGLLAPTKGSIDTFETKAKLPPWLQTIRTIEKESGDEKARGPALVLTLAGPGQRYDIPDVGLGVTSLPSPQRISCAMELVQQGWLIRGNIVFANEADAKELVTVLEQAQQRITDSRIFSALLRRQHLLNVVTGLSLARTGARVSYATSMSIADARAILAAAAQTLAAYFSAQPQP